MSKTLEQMRAELNGDGALDYFSKLLAPVKAAYNHMPGAPIAQAALGMASDMFGQTIGVPYGIGKQVATGQLTGDAKGTAYAYDQAQQLANQVRYTPPTQAGRDIYEGVNKLPQVVTGSTMGTGPLPQLINANMRFTPDDVRVAGKTAIEDIRNLPMDYMNARAGLQREYPTMGSRLASTTEAAGNVARPVAEKAYDMYMNPRDGSESSVSPVANMSGMFDVGSPMYAVKPKGGNWPTNLGSTIPLKEQGELGQHLSSVQYNDPIAVFENQLTKHFTRGIDNRQLVRDWEDYLNGYLSIHAKGIQYSDPNGTAMQALKKEATDKFAEAYNDGTIGAADIEPTDKKLFTASQIEQTLPAYNSWVMGPYQKYITNQMGTGLATDPLLQAVNEGGMPLKEIFNLERDPSDYVIKKGENRRKDFAKELTDYGNKPEVIENTPIGQTTATTPEGLEYENVLDGQLYPKGPYSFKDDGGGTTRFPALSKLNRDSLITDFLSEPDKETGFSNIRKQVFKDLISGNLDPGKLSNVTPATITRQMIKEKMAEFKEQQLSKQGAADWIPKRAASMPTDMEFDDGSKMTIITPEMANTDEAMTARDLGQITIDLNQCVGAGCHATQDYSGHGPYLVPHTGKPPRGKVEYDKYGYMRRLKDGEIEIASLKDPEGVSQLTIRLDLDKKRLTDYEKDRIVNQWIIDNAPDYRDEYNTDIETFGEKPALKNAMQLYPEIESVLNKAIYSGKKDIREMKGKNNVKIKEEYIPQILQWLNQNANNLTDVRDLENLPNVHDLTRSFDSVGKLMDKHHHWNVETVEEFFDKLVENKLLPRFFTTDDFALKATENGVDLSASPTRAEGEQSKYPKGADSYMMDMIDYFEPGVVRRGYGGFDRIISYNPRTRDVVVSQVAPDPNNLGGWIDHPRYGGPRTHSTMPTPGDFRTEMGRPMRGLREPINELENVAQQFEAEPDQQFQPERPNQASLQHTNRVIRSYLDGQDIEFDHRTPNVRVLMGAQNPEARLPRFAQQSVVEMLLDQDNRTADIRELLNHLQIRGGEGLELTEPQVENLLNILINWTERYPLNE